VKMSAQAAAGVGDRCLKRRARRVITRASAQAEATLLGPTGLGNLGDQRAKTALGEVPDIYVSLKP
jgi:hypothetical protein